LAAGLLLTCWAVYTVSHSVWTADTPGQLTQLPPTHFFADSASRNGRIQETGTDVTASTRRTADGSVNQTKLRLLVAIPQAYFGDAADLEQVLEPSAESFREIQEAMSAGLEPVATSARRAVGLFLCELPPIEYDVQ
jgi:hypothetical protein